MVRKQFRNVSSSVVADDDRLSLRWGGGVINEPMTTEVEYRCKHDSDVQGPAMRTALGYDSAVPFRRQLHIITHFRTQFVVLERL